MVLCYKVHLSRCILGLRRSCMILHLKLRAMEMRIMASILKKVKQSRRHPKGLCQTTLLCRRIELYLHHVCQCRRHCQHQTVIKSQWIQDHQKHPFPVYRPLDQVCGIIFLVFNMSYRQRPKEIVVNYSHSLLWLSIAGVVKKCKREIMWLVIGNGV